MALICSNCGKSLPSEHARFCSNCGTVVASRAVDDRLEMLDPASRPREGRRPALREQIAQQPAAQPSRSTVSKDEPPSWIRKLESENSRRSADAPAVSNRGSGGKTTSDRDEHEADSQPQVVDAPLSARHDAGEVPAENFVIGTPLGVREDAAQENEEMPAAYLEHAKRAEQVGQAASSATNRFPVEEEPTRPLTDEVGDVSEAVQRSDLNRSADSQSLKALDERPTQITPTMAHGHLELLDTVPVVTHAYQPAAAPARMGAVGAVRSAPAAPERGSTTATGLASRAVSRSGVSPARRRGSRFLFLASCGLVLAVAFVVWLLLAQPFSVPAATQPQQSFKDSTLGIALLYPTGWQVTVDHQNKTVRLYDSSQTAQVTISVDDTMPADGVQYLKQRAAKLGMTAVKTEAPLTFAGAPWQQVSGAIQEQGASYTQALLGTAHGQRFYTIAQAAPQSVYKDEEQIVFSPLRSSVRFIG